MPTLFDSHEEFNEWFSKDIESHAENKSAIDESKYKSSEKVPLSCLLQCFCIYKWITHNIFQVICIECVNIQPLCLLTVPVSGAKHLTVCVSDQLSRLHMILKPFMLRRIKKDVENELSDKVEE